MKDGKEQRKRLKRPAQRLVNVPVLRKTVECPSCGSEIELWACDEGAQCMWCGHHIITPCRRVH